MANLEWSDEMGSRGRAAWLVLVKGGTITAFAGASIPGLVAVLGSQYRKNGKWSHTSYRLALAPGVTAIRGQDGWEEGTFCEGLAQAARDIDGYRPPVDSWSEVAKVLGVSVCEAERFLRNWNRRGARFSVEKLDESAAALKAL